jgi:DNA-binding response OmpR family regulator
MTTLTESPQILLLTDDSAEESHTTHILGKYHFANSLIKLRRSGEAFKFFAACQAKNEKAEPLPELIIFGLQSPVQSSLALLTESRRGPLAEIPLIIALDSRDEEAEIRKLNLPLSACISRPIGFFKLLEAMQKLQMRWIVLRPK